MKILILSSTPWRNDNSFGNSFSNIFGGMKDIEIANIYCKYGCPDNVIVKKSFQITEKSLIKNLINKKNPSGVDTSDNIAEKLNLLGNTIVNHVKKSRFQLYFWIRDLVWKVGRWKSEELKKFIDEFKPDLIFQPIYYSNYLSDMAMFLKKHTNAPMVGYISDDNYTLRQFRISPLYWIDRLYKRKKVKKVIDLCEILYVISDIQKKEYDKCFNKDCKLLWKGAEFTEQPVYEQQDREIIKFVYTGNIGVGRYKQLSLIGQALEKINSNEKKAELNLYTATPMSKKMLSALDIQNAINLKGAVSFEEVRKIQADSDVLIHVESFDLKNRLETRQSFSTKIVDYFETAKCIFAVGPSDVASIDYLIQNDAAITATSEKEIEEKLRNLVEKSELVKEYGDKAWECGKRNHKIDEIQAMLYKDFKELVEK